MKQHSMKKLLGNMSWNVAGNIIGRTLGPLLQILIARLLMPSDFGLFAIVLAVFALLEVIRDLGLTHAIIVDRNNEDYISLQFTAQLILASVLFVIVYLLSPFAAGLFSLPELETILPVVGAMLFLTAASDPVIASLLKKQNYRTLAVRQVLQPTVTGVTGLALAYAGYGVYSLVYGLLAGHIAITAYLCWLHYDRFRLAWNLNTLLRLFSFGKHIIMQRLSGFFVNQADSFFVSMNLGASNLGLYRLGNQLAFLVPGLVFPQVQQVLFTEFSSHKDVSRIAVPYYHYIRWSGALLLIYSILGYLLIPYLVDWVLGKQWLGIVPVFQLFAAGTVTGSLAAMNNETAKPLGMVRHYTIFTILRSLATILAVIVASTYSLHAVVLAWVCVGLLANVANETVFHTYQKVVPLRAEKYLVYSSAWLWAGYVIWNTSL